jgi:O-methyltransferase
MRAEDYAKLTRDLERELVAGARSVAILGMTDTALHLLTSLVSAGLQAVLSGVYTSGVTSEDVDPRLPVPVLPVKSLSEADCDVLVVAADEEKEDLLLEAFPYVNGTPRVIVAGYGHLAFRDQVFHEELSQLLVPSLANGYPNSLIHLYQCLVNAARLNLQGVVAEFGMYKGGTTMFLSRVIERLGTNWSVIGFDTFNGFPPKRSLLDMYDHAGCIFTDLPAVRCYLASRNAEIVEGNIVETCTRLENETLVLTFMDTDNYSPAEAALAVVRERTVIGGAIVFDHFTGINRFRYTLGERMAGRILLDDPRYFHLHGTGVFYRQR